MVSRQLRASGGIWFSLGGEQVLVDPGPGSLVKCHSSRPKMDPVGLSGVILTHRHLDHANDVNAIIEAMTEGGSNRKGYLLAPRDAFSGADPVVQMYVRDFLEEQDWLEAGKEIKRGSFILRTPLRHLHPVETYGLQFLLPNLNIGLIADTAYFPELIEAYRGADVLIINVVIFRDKMPKKIYHLNLGQARELIREIKPRLAILTHFGLTMLQQKPYRLAQALQEELGTKVVAAGDGMTIPLGTVDSSQ